MTLETAGADGDASPASPGLLTPELPLEPELLPLELLSPLEPELLSSLEPELLSSLEPELPAPEFGIVLLDEQPTTRRKQPRETILARSIAAVYQPSADEHGSTRQERRRFAPDGLLVGGDARDVLAEDQRVDIVRALVRVDRLEVAEVAHHRVLERDAVAAEDVAADA